MKACFKYVFLLSLSVFFVTNSLFSFDEENDYLKKKTLYIRFGNFADAKVINTDNQEHSYGVLILGAGYEGFSSHLFGVKIYGDLAFPHLNDSFRGIYFRSGFLFTFHPIPDFALDPYLQAGVGFLFGALPIPDANNPAEKDTKIIGNIYPVFGIGLSLSKNTPVRLGFELSLTPNIISTKKNTGNLLKPALSQLIFYFTIPY